MTKRTLSILGLIVGAVGLALCLAVIIGSWWVNSPITYGLLFRVFPPIEASLSFGDSTVEEFNTIVADTQAQFTQVTDAKPLVTALEDEIQQVTVYVNVASSVADSVEQGVNEFAGSVQTDGPSWVISRAAGRLLGSLSNVTDALDSATLLTQQIGEGRTDKIDLLNAQLDTLQGQVVEVEDVIEQTQDDVALIKSRVPRWINLASLLVTLLFLWFGVAHYFLLRACWRALRPQKAEHDVVDALNQQLEALQSSLAEFKAIPKK